jgi:hypothetical protein
VFAEGNFFWTNINETLEIILTSHEWGYDGSHLTKFMVKFSMATSNSFVIFGRKLTLRLLSYAYEDLVNMGMCTMIFDRVVALDMA